MLDACSGDALSAVLELIQDRLNTWPDAIRVAPRRWCFDLLAQRDQPRLRVVRHLDLKDCQPELRAETLARVTECPNLEHVVDLRLDNHGVGTVGARALAQASVFRRVRALSLNHCGLDAKGVEAIVVSPTWVELEHLEIAGASGVEVGRALGMRKKRWLLGLNAHGLALGVQSMALQRVAQALDRPVTLDLGRNQIDDASLRELLEGVDWTRLENLNLSGNELTDEGLLALCASGALQTLRQLDLRWATTSDAGGEGVLAIAREDTPHLTHLNLGHGQVRRDAVVALASKPALRVLDLSANPIEDEGLEAMAGATWPCLEALELAATQVTDHGLRALARSGALGALRYVNLTINEGVSMAGTVELMGGLPSLRGLRCWGSGEELSRAVQSPAWGKLELLDMRHGQRLRDEGVLALAGSPHLGRLRRLWVTRNEITAEGAAALASSTVLLEGLEELDLGTNLIGDEGLGHLLASPHLRQIKVLRLRSTGLTEAGIRALCDPGNALRLPNLRVLDLSLNRLSDDAGRALLRASWMHQLEFLGVMDMVWEERISNTVLRSIREASQFRGTHVDGRRLHLGGG